jgi:sRNA-binding protein
MSSKSDPQNIIGILAEKFPRAFFLSGEKRKPLKIGINRDLAENTDVKISSSKLRAALRVHANSLAYLRASCIEGEARLGLDGEVAGVLQRRRGTHGANSPSWGA